MKQRTAQILSAVLFLFLFVWGGYSFLAYIGVPVHGMVLLRDTAQSAVSGACPGDGLICRGIHSFVPFLSHTIARAAPFMWYAVLCIIIYFLFVGWQGVRTGEFSLRFRWHIWQVILLFVGCVWLLFTTLSLSSTDGTPALQIVEPTKLAYGDIGEGPLQSLKENFDDLNTRGCLTYLGDSTEGIKVYSMKGTCVQLSFVTRVIPQILFVLALFFELLVVGRFLLTLLRVRPRSDLQEFVLSAGLGGGAWIATLWFISVFGIFTYEVGWALVVFVPILLLPHTRHWLRKVFLNAYDLDMPWQSAGVLLFWLLVSYFALNFLTVVRPFPIGWDDLGSYLNRPRLLVSYGHFLFSMASFQWEYLTSLGYLLFGYDNTFGATASMLINWSAGILAVLAIITIARTFLGNGKGLIAALLFYTLPLVGHFSFADMKVDNAVFAFGALAMFAGFAGLFPGADEHQEGGKAAAAHAVEPVAKTGWRAFLPHRWEWLLLSGIFAGLALGFKITAAMVFLALIAVFLGTAHWGAFVGGIFLGIFVLSRQGLNINAVANRLGITISHSVFSVSALLLGLACLGAVFLYKRKNLTVSLSGLALFLAGTAIVVFPWIEHNNILRGRIIPRMELGAENTISPTIDFTGATGLPPSKHVRTLPAELKLDRNNPACKGTGGTEELDRYWGFSKGWGHYLTLPWRSVLNLDSAGYYVTTIPALLLFPLLLLLPYFWSKKGRWLRWMFVATAFILVEWMFLANGIPWYGIGVFLGLVLALEALVVRAPDPFNRVLVSLLIALSLFVAYANRIWQFEQQRNLLEYPFGKVSADTLRIRTIPYYDTIRKYVVDRNASMPERPYLYRVGTFITYFIPRNLEIIGLTDHQLDQFNCLNQERDHELTLKRLKALGFNSIVFDTNTATIEKDPNGTLHKKAQEFVDFLNDPKLGLQVVISDPGQGVAFVLIP